MPPVFAEMHDNSIRAGRFNEHCSRYRFRLFTPTCLPQCGNVVYINSQPCHSVSIISEDMSCRQEKEYVKTLLFSPCYSFYQLNSSGVFSLCCMHPCCLAILILNMHISTIGQKDGDGHRVNLPRRKHQSR